MYPFFFFLCDGLVRWLARTVLIFFISEFKRCLFLSATFICKKHFVQRFLQSLSDSHSFLVVSSHVSVLPVLINPIISSFECCCCKLVDGETFLFFKKIQMYQGSWFSMVQLLFHGNSSVHHNNQFQSWTRCTCFSMWITDL